MNEVLINMSATIDYRKQSRLQRYKIPEPLPGAWLKTRLCQTAANLGEHVIDIRQFLYPNPSRLRGVSVSAGRSLLKRQTPLRECRSARR
jgi:hypothetical protein